MSSICFYTNSRHNETERFLAQHRKHGNTFMKTDTGYEKWWSVALVYITIDNFDNKIKQQKQFSFIIVAKLQCLDL